MTDFSHHIIRGAVDRHTYLLQKTFCLAFFGFMPALLAAEPLVPSDGFVPIAVSGDVEIDSIRVERYRKSNAYPDETPNRLTIKLWISEPDVQQPHASRILFNPDDRERDWQSQVVKITSIEPIEDDTGTQLLTPARREVMHCLHEDGWNFQRKVTRKKSGLLIPLILDVPSRLATRIPLIKGRAVVHEVKQVDIEFRELPSLHGKELTHPLLDDFPVRFEIDTSFGLRDEPILRLTTPRFDAKLRRWDLFSEGKSVWLNTTPRPPVRSANQSIHEQQYSQEIDATHTLKLTLLECFNPREFLFEFCDIELP